MRLGRLARKHGLPRWATRAAKKSDRPLADGLAVADLHRDRLSREEVEAMIAVVANLDDFERARSRTWEVRLLAAGIATEPR